MQWRRREGKDVWHFCGNCSKWPSKDFILAETKPTYGEGCNECRAKEKREDCAPIGE